MNFKNKKLQSNILISTYEQDTGKVKDRQQPESDMFRRSIENVKEVGQKTQIQFDKSERKFDKMVKNIV